MVKIILKSAVQLAILDHENENHVEEVIKIYRGLRDEFRPDSFGSLNGNAVYHEEWYLSHFCIFSVSTILNNSFIKFPDLTKPEADSKARAYFRKPIQMRLHRIRPKQDGGVTSLQIRCTKNSGIMHNTETRSAFWLVTDPERSYLVGDGRDNITTRAV